MYTTWANALPVSVRQYSSAPSGPSARAVAESRRGSSAIRSSSSAARCKMQRPPSFHASVNCTPAARSARQSDTSTSACASCRVRETCAACLSQKTITDRVTGSDGSREIRRSYFVLSFQ